MKSVSEPQRMSHATIIDVLHTGEKFSQKRLAEISGYHSRQIARLMAKWQQAGIPIQMEKDGKYTLYFIRPEDRALDLSIVRLSEDEKFALLMAVSISEKTMSQSSFAAPLKRIQQHLLAQYQHEDAPFMYDEDGWEESFVFPAQQEDSIDSTVFETIRNAINDMETVEMIYSTASKGGEQSQRRFDPMRMIVGTWVVQGWCHKNKGFRDFKMSRIQSATPTHEKAKLRDYDKLKQTQARRFGQIEEGDTVHTYRLLFEKELYPYFEKKQFHPTQDIKWQPDGRFMVIYKAGSIHAMRSWIMSWGKRVEVRSPLELIRLMEDEIKSLAQSYDVKL